MTTAPVPAAVPVPTARSASARETRPLREPAAFTGLPRTAESASVDAAIRVLVVDDHPTVHLGLAAVLSTTQGIELAGSATTGKEGVRRFVEHRPDVVILDLAMPDQPGLVSLRQMLDHDPDALVLVLTASAAAEDVVEAVRAGAAGYLLKDTDGAGLIAAVRAVLRGEVPVDARLTRALARSSDPGPRVTLTPREHDVLRLLHEGLTNQQIALRLGIRANTVKAHLRNAFERIGVADRTSAALWAHQHLTDTPYTPDRGRRS